MEAQQAVVPPFLSKCYEMVDDPSTDAVVSWGTAGNSFVIWDPHSFGRDLLPKYFKHSNLSSFVRQLNTYGFRKIDPDRYEFANEGFLKGQRHLLRTIIRRKPAQSSSQVQQSQGKNTSGKACLELGKFGLEEEIERLKRDKDLLLKELVKLRQHQQNTDRQLHSLRQRLHEMEQNQQQMLSFLAMAVQSPGFFAQFVQQNENNKRRFEANRKRRLPALEQSVMDGLEACSDGQIIKYQPLTQLNPQFFEPCATEVSSPSLMQESSVGTSDDLKPMSNGISDLCINVDDLSIGMDPSASAEEISSPDYLGIIEQLLYAPVPENIEQIEPHTLENFILDFNFPQKEIQMEALEKIDGPSEQFGGSNPAPDVPDMHNQSEFFLGS